MERAAKELKEWLESTGLKVTAQTITEGVIVCRATREDGSWAEVLGTSLLDGLMRLARELSLEVRC